MSMIETKGKTYLADVLCPTCPDCGKPIVIKKYQEIENFSDPDTSIIEKSTVSLGFCSDECGNITVGWRPKNKHGENL